MGVVIIGGGISGLSTAYYLAKTGTPSTLIERRPRLGGVIRTERAGGCLIEAGPDSFLSVKPAAMDLIAELGLAAEVIGSNDHLRKTYIWKTGRLRLLPDGLQFLVPTRIIPIVTTPLLGWGAKLRMGAEWFRRPPRTPRPDCSVADFVRDHYGSDVVDYFAEPLLSGVYGGSPEMLSIHSVLPRFVELETKYGSVTRGVLAGRGASSGRGAPLFRTLKGGLGQLIEALERAVTPRVRAVTGEAETIERAGEGFRIRVSGDWMHAQRLVLACEAHQAARLVRTMDATLADALASVPYSSSMTMALGFERRRLGAIPQGFGFLVPKKERRRLVACTFVGTKFSHRIPDDVVLLRCFLGGTGGDTVLAESDASLTAGVLEELHAMIGLKAAPLFTRIYRWPHSMAQYIVGHSAKMKEIDERLRLTSGLHLAGNAYQGIGIPDCIRTGKLAAEKLVGTSVAP